MFLVKALAWLIVYPLVILGFGISIAVSCLWFLFNSPVDIWNVLSDGIEEATVDD
jgi:hypothetical protein